MTDIPRQDAEYLDGFRNDLAGALDSLPPVDDTEAWAEAITDLLQDAGWRMVTAQDWKEMTAAWMFARLR